MSAIASLFEQAQLAEAAYANFFDVAGNLITTGTQLETAAGVLEQEVDMIGRHHVVQHAEAETLPGFEKPVQITLAVTRKLEQEFFLVATVRDMPDVAGEEMTIGTVVEANQLVALVRP